MHTMVVMPFPVAMMPMMIAIVIVVVVSKCRRREHGCCGHNDGKADLLHLFALKS
jgi:hypothetical protein